MPVGSIAARTVDQGQSFTVDVSSNFRDPDGDALTYTAESSNEGVATARAAGSQINVAAIGPGAATVTVTASDPGGRTAGQSFEVAVRGSIGDDFGSAGSLNDWRGLNDAGISVRRRRPQRDEQNGGPAGDRRARLDADADLLGDPGQDGADDAPGEPGRGIAHGPPPLHGLPSRLADA